MSEINIDESMVGWGCRTRGGEVVRIASVGSNQNLKYPINVITLDGQRAWEVTRHGANYATFSDSEYDIVEVWPPSAQAAPATAAQVLEAGAQHMRDRAEYYDSPEGERSMAATVKVFNELTGSELTEEAGWLFMAVLKLVRSQQGAFRADNYEDGAAYIALMAEAAFKGRT